MRQQLLQRLDQLKAEFEAGQKMLADKEAEIVNLRNTMLRISGAIQVLEEELTKENLPAGNGDEQPVGQGEKVAQ